jgi:hypothetical protein
LKRKNDYQRGNNKSGHKIQHLQVQDQDKTQQSPEATLQGPSQSVGEPD